MQWKRIGFFKGTFAFDFKIVGFNLDYLGRNRWIFSVSEFFKIWFIVVKF